MMKGLLAAWLLVSSALRGQEGREVRYEFVQDGNAYSFRGHFVVDAGRECVLNVLFDVDHVSKFTPDASSIQLVQQGEGWYDVTYTYRRFLIFENQSTWRRTLKRDEGKVVFELLSSRNNRGIMPDVTASSGYYGVSTEGDVQAVEYFQESALGAGSLNARYIAEARQKAIEFLQGLKAYVQKACRQTGPGAA